MLWMQAAACIGVMARGRRVGHARGEVQLRRAWRGHGVVLPAMEMVLPRGRRERKYRLKGGRTRAVVAYWFDKEKIEKNRGGAVGGKK